MTQDDDLSPAVRLAALEVTQHEHELTEQVQALQERGAAC